MNADDLLFALTLFAALGSGLIAGVFFAFSTFVMKALARLRDHEGIAAMQAINETVLNPLFLGTFLGTAAASMLAVIVSLSRRQESGAVYLLLGGLLYLVGTFMVTMAFNVPRNNVLASVTANSAGASTVWKGYLASWVSWNHVRTVAALAAAALFSLALSVD